MRIWIFIFLLIQSCAYDYEFKPVEPYYIFHDNSSKVWLINHVYKNGKDEVPLSLEFKKVIIFYKSRNCFVYQVNNIGDNQGEKGIFSLGIKSNKFQMDFKNKSWSFKIESLSEEKIKLTSIGSKESYRMELISFPEP